MKITGKLRSQLRLQNSAFIVLLLLVSGLLAFISHRYVIEADWSTSQRNTLSEASQALLNTMQHMPVFTVYATEEDHVRKPINEMLRRYQRIQPGISIRFVNPEMEPDRVRELGIQVNGEVIIGQCSVKLALVARRAS